MDKLNKISRQFTKIPIDVRLYFEDLSLYGHRSYVYNNKNILHTLYSYPDLIFSITDDEVRVEALDYLLERNTNVGKVLGVVFKAKNEPVPNNMLNIKTIADIGQAQMDYIARNVSKYNMWAASSHKLMEILIKNSAIIERIGTGRAVAQWFNAVSIQHILTSQEATNALIKDRRYILQYNQAIQKMIVNSSTGVNAIFNNISEYAKWFNTNYISNSELAVRNMMIDSTSFRSALSANGTNLKLFSSIVDYKVFKALISNYDVLKNISKLSEDELNKANFTNALYSGMGYTNSQIREIYESIHKVLLSNLTKIRIDTITSAAVLDIPFMTTDNTITMGGILTNVIDVQPGYIYRLVNVRVNGGDKIGIKSFINNNRSQIFKSSNTNAESLNFMTKVDGGATNLGSSSSVSIYRIEGWYFGKLKIERSDQYTDFIYLKYTLN